MHHDIHVTQLFALIEFFGQINHFFILSQGGLIFLMSHKQNLVYISLRDHQIQIVTNLKVQNQIIEI